MRRFWDEEQTSWWVFEFCLFWGLWVLELMSKRVDEFLSFAYFGVGEFVRWWTDELISFWVCFCGSCAFCFWGDCAFVRWWVLAFLRWWVIELTSLQVEETISWWVLEHVNWRVDACGSCWAISSLPTASSLLFPRYVYKEECSSCVGSSNLDPLKVNTASIKVENAFSERMF